MRVCLVGKYPPIQGGVSMHNYWIARSLAQRGHEVHVVTNADEVEDGFRILLTQADEQWYRPRFDHGSVEVWKTESFEKKYRHIPLANPFVTKLASLVTEVVESHSLEVIVAYYFEPYTIAAYLASIWTGVPLIVRHAGSDAGRLLRIDQLRRCYAEILQRSQLIATSATLTETFISLGVKPNKLYPDPGFNLPKEYFNPRVKPLKINEFLSELVETVPGYVQSSLCMHTEPLDLSYPSLGIYGKVGETKGTFDLIRALSNLKKKGLRFNFAAIAHGWPEQEKRFIDAVNETGLAEFTRILPFIPHWRIPAFLRSMSAICFLERGFPIKFHSPTVPTEVLSCGSCLIVSAEAARKQTFCEYMIHRQNVLIVRDPRDQKELENALQVILEDPVSGHSIGTNGALLQDYLEDHPACIERYELMLREVLSDTRGTSPFFVDIAFTGSKLQREIQKYFPYTIRFLGSQAMDLIEQMIEPRSPLHQPNSHERSVEIAEAITSIIEEQYAQKAFLRDLVIWELYRVVSTDDSDTETMVEMLFRSELLPGNGVLREQIIGMVPLRFGNIRLREFRYDMEKLTKGIARDTMLNTVAAEPTYYLFQYLPSRSHARVIRVEPYVFLLLKLCNGELTVQEICSKLEAIEFNGRALFQGSALESCIRAIERFYSHGLIRFTHVEASHI